MKDEKRFTVPEATVITFMNTDIIVTSSQGGMGQGAGEGPFDEYED